MSQNSLWVVVHVEAFEYKEVGWLSSHCVGAIRVGCHSASRFSRCQLFFGEHGSVLMRSAIHVCCVVFVFVECN